MTPQFDPKDPRDVRNDYFDWSPHLDSAVTITSADPITCSDPDFTVIGGVISGKKILFSMSGGVAGRNYKIESVVRTSDGETVVRHGIVPVRSGL